MIIIKTVFVMMVLLSSSMLCSKLSTMIVFAIVCSKHLNCVFGMICVKYEWTLVLLRLLQGFYNLWQWPIRAQRHKVIWQDKNRLNQCQFLMTWRLCCACQKLFCIVCVIQDTNDLQLQTLYCTLVLLNDVLWLAWFGPFSL